MSAPRLSVRMPSTDARSLLRRKLKSPNQKTSSNRVVTSAEMAQKWRGKCYGIPALMIYRDGAVTLLPRRRP